MANLQLDAAGADEVKLFGRERRGCTAPVVHRQHGAGRDVLPPEVRLRLPKHFADALWDLRGWSRVTFGCLGLRSLLHFCHRISCDLQGSLSLLAEEFTHQLLLRRTARGFVKAKMLQLSHTTHSSVFVCLCLTILFHGSQRSCNPQPRTIIFTNFQQQ